MKRDPEQIFDELLIIRCQERDDEAISLLWNRWHPRILKWSFGFLKNDDLASEVAQESWISIFKGIGKLKDPALFRFWAYKIVQRRSADYIRKVQRERELTTELEYEYRDTDEPSSHSEVELTLRAIKELPPMHQEMLRLFYLEKFTVKEIAKMTRLPVGTIKSRLFYSRQQLKIKLKEVSYE